MLLALVFAVVGYGLVQLTGKPLVPATGAAALLFLAALAVALTDQVG